MSIEDYGKHYDEVYSQDNKPKEEDGHGWIQWKGTDVCIDLHCKCGFHGHFDGDFLYYWRCPKCNRVYATGQNIKLIELNDEQKEFVEKDRPSLIKIGDTE